MVEGAQRCTSEGSDVHISSTVKVREKCVIDKGKHGAQSMRNV